jgi:L-Ala-D/L-Glu epimerase
MKLHVQVERWPLAIPFRISGYLFEQMELLVVSLERDGVVGRGEASGVYYRSETAASMTAALVALRTQIEAGLDRARLQSLLPPGGARNALDCALWDLESQLSGQPAWRLAGLERPPEPLLTTFTCGAESPEVMARVARGYQNARAIKVKLTGEACDADRVRAVREAVPGAWLGVDANQGFSLPFLDALMPVLVEADVQLIEQPFAVGQEALLDGFRPVIPIAADESVQSVDDLAAMAGRFAVINIKLDKCGGLTGGLQMARAALSMGMQCMVGNMIGTSLAMAPASIVGQLCSVVDLDGPALLARDRVPAVQYQDGYMSCPPGIWGQSV